jgi:hypothetical protein
MQVIGGGGGGCQAVTERTGQRRPLISLAIFHVSEPDGIGAQQIVHGVSGCTDGLEKVRAGQTGEQVTGVVQAGVFGEGGNDIGVQVRTRMQTEEPERPGGVGRQVLLRPGEHRLDGAAGHAGPLAIQATTELRDLVLAVRYRQRKFARPPPTSRPKHEVYVECIGRTGRRGRGDAP